MKNLNRATRIFSSAHGAAAIAFLIIYLVILNAFRQGPSARDWGSVFFDPRHAFDRQYSDIRTAQANAFIENASYNSLGVKAGPDPSICLGVASVQRDGARYFRTTVGTILDGLSISERNDVTLKVFIANVEPMSHQAFQEPWLAHVADDTMTYENVSEERKCI